EGIVKVHAELGEGAVGGGLDDAGQAGFGGPIELALAEPRVSQAVAFGFPGLGAVEQYDANVTDVGKMVQASGEDFGMDGAGSWFIEIRLVPGDQLAVDLG